MKKTIFTATWVGIVAIALAVGYLSPPKQKAEAEVKQEITSEASVKASNPVPSPVPSPTKIVAEAPQKPDIKNLPLPEVVTDYIWEKSRESGFSYYLLLAIAKQESKFDTSSKSSTGDYGLFQVNAYRTAPWIAAELGYKNYNLTDYKTNINFAVFYLSYIREYWDKNGLSGIDLQRMTLMSYNRGPSGAKRYLENHGYYSAYVTNIENYKKQLEDNNY
jgi:soluble lytic murein transglycosylase-like protein